MKILFISDIHSNFEALKNLEKDIVESDFVFCLGDILGYHCEVNEVIDFLKKYSIICIAGNHDRYIINFDEVNGKSINESVKFGIEYSQKYITEKNIKWLKSLPTSVSFTINGTSIFCCHGSPWDVTNEYFYSNKKERIAQMNNFNFDIIAFGHTHRMYEKITSNKIIINPGSVGQARDELGKICAKILDLDKREITNIVKGYNFKKVIDLALKNGAKEWIYKHFPKEE